MNKKVILATGGTGGHIFPAIALYESLQKEGYRPLLFVDNRFLNFTKHLTGKPNYQVIMSDKMSGNIFKKLLGLCKLMFGVVQALIHIIKMNPSLVIGFGGYTTFPTIMAAKIMRKKIILHEQNTVMGNANKFLERFSDLVATTFPEVRNISKRTKQVFTGNFIRNRISTRKKTTIPKTDKNITITVIGGSQGASILSEVVPEAIIRFSKQAKLKVKVFHQARVGDVDAVRNLYEQYNISNEVQPFFEDIEKKVSESHIVVSRSGASTVADLIEVGRTAILIPIPYSFGNHQYYNAKYLESKRACWIIEQSNFTITTLSRKLEEIFANEQLLIEYSQNISKLRKEGVSIILPVIKKICAK